MEGVWASIENISEAIWGTTEAIWSSGMVWRNDDYSQWDQVIYFINAVDWTEPWIIILMLFHLLTFIAIILSWGHFNIQAAILVLLALTCAASESLNKLAADNYRLFTNTQYFDSNGFFVFVMLAGPVIFNCFVIIMCWLHAAWKMMIKVALLKRKASEQRRSKQVMKDSKKHQ